MLDDLLDVARFTQGKIQLAKETVDLTRLAADVLENMGPLAVARQQQLEVAISPGPLWVRGDRRRLQQVQVNLLTNALIATGTGGTVTVAIASRPASIDEAEEGQCTGRTVDVMLLLMVRDTGCGIPQEDLQRVFEPFFTTKAVGKGTGLGLFLSRETVLAHGGSLTIESEVGKGTTVTVALPGWRSESAEVG